MRPIFPTLTFSVLETVVDSAYCCGFMSAARMDGRMWDETLTMMTSVLYYLLLLMMISLATRVSNL